ncbi:MAG: RluA family pseudouridine synthase [Candidatus Gracilibacteria bacterium]|nr:RluA family pseudouridine synthase [Candidatus Gracilibacteria bacterium]
MKTQFSIFIPRQEVRRVDMYLSTLFPDHSRSYMQKLIEKGRLQVNGKVLDSNKRVKKGDVLEIEFETEKSHLQAEDMNLEVIFDNEDFAVISKDPGVNTHTVPGEFGNTGTLVNALLHHFGNLSVINGVERPGIVHRLDKDTSGLILIAKNDRSMKALQKKMADRKIKKFYYAVVLGLVKDQEGMIESFIGRDPNDRKRMTTENPVNPKLAKTKFTLLHHLGDKYSLLEIELFTGRTHQIRVHMSAIGHPIIADKVYGNEKTNKEVATKYGLTRQWLHARRLALNVFGVDYEFIAPLKKDIAKMLEENGIEVD